MDLGVGREVTWYSRDITCLHACSGMYLNVPGVLQEYLGAMVEPLVHDPECHLLCPDHSGSGQGAIK